MGEIQGQLLLTGGTVLKNRLVLLTGETVLKNHQVLQIGETNLKGRLRQLLVIRGHPHQTGVVLDLRHQGGRDPVLHHRGRDHPEVVTLDQVLHDKMVDLRHLIGG